MEDVTESRLLKAPENRINFKPYDIYHKMSQTEKKQMWDKLQKDTVKFSAGLDEKVLPLMPKNKSATISGKRNFLKIYAERQAKLQAQIDWLRNEQEKHRKT